MENKNEAPRVIIQLILSATVYYLFTFKFKDDLIEILSLQVYYQVLVIVVIVNGYVSKWMDALRMWVCHQWMMYFSKSYKAKHIQKVKVTVIEKSKRAKLSEETQKMVEELVDTNIELENEISEVYKELSRFKGT